MKKYLLMTGFMLVVAFGCNEDNLSFSVTPSLGFESTQGTVLENNAAGIRVKLFSNVSVTETGTATVTLNNFQNLEYGVDFTTEPELVDNSLELELEPGGELPSFFVYPTFNGKERQLDFQLTEITGAGVELASATALSYLLTIKSLGCPTGVVPVTLTDTFNTCSTDFATPTGWTEAFETSKVDRGWGCRAFGVSASRAPRASAFGGTAGEDKAWMIWAPQRVAAGSKVTIKFSVFSQFSGPGIVKVKWSSDYTGSGNPTVANWTEMGSINSEFPAAGSQSWKDIEKQFTDICGEDVYIAFQFSGATNAASASWDIDDFSFKIEN